MFDKIELFKAFSQLLFGMLGAVLIQWLFFHRSQPIETVDITGIVKSFESEVLHQKLSADELRTKVTQFSHALDAAMDDYSGNHHVILVPQEIVIKGAIDSTAEIKAIIKKRFNA